MIVTIPSSFASYAPGFNPALVGQVASVTLTAQDAKMPAADCDFVHEKADGMLYAVYEVRGWTEAGDKVCFNHIVPMPSSMQTAEHQTNKWVTGSDYYFWRPVFQIVEESDQPVEGVDLDELSRIRCCIKLGQYKKNNEIRFNIQSIWPDKRHR